MNSSVVSELVRTRKLPLTWEVKELGELPGLAVAIEKSINHPCFGKRFAVLILFIKWANRRAKEQLLAIGRPDGIRGTMRHEGELVRFSTTSGQQPDLRFALAALLLVLCILT